MTAATSERVPVLAGLLVLTVLAGATVFGASATTTHDETGTTALAQVDNGTGTPVVFQGQSGIEPLDVGNGSAADFQTSDGVVLQDPVPEDQPRTIYTATSNEDQLIVRSPDITDYEFRLPSGGDIAGGTVPGGTEELTIWAEYNFASVSDLEVTVSRGDVDKTGEVIGDEASPVAGPTNESDSVRIPLDISTLAPGEYSVEIAPTNGNPDHPFAVVQDTFTIPSVPPEELELAERTVTGGEHVRFDIEAALEGEYHLVTIDRDDGIGSGRDVFRDVNDTYQTGTTGDQAYAIVEIDGGFGTGAIDTGELATGEVEVTLHDTVDPAEPDLDTAVEDETTLEIVEPSITLDEPSRMYANGSATVSGSVSPDVTEVTLYARGDDEYHRVAVEGSNTIPASGGEFETEDAELERDDGQAGNDVLASPGLYRIAVVPGDAGPSLSPSEVETRTSDVQSLRVADTELDASATFVRGQVAVGDWITVSGSATAADRVWIGFVGPNGTVDVTDPVAVRSNGTFQAGGITVGNNSLGESIGTGSVVMPVLSPGPDGEFGDDVSSDEFHGLVRDLNDRSLTQAEAIARLRAETVEDGDSDDRNVTRRFEYAVPRLSIDAVNGGHDRQSTTAALTEQSVGDPTTQQARVNGLAAAVLDEWTASQTPIAGLAEGLLGFGALDTSELRTTT